MAGVWLAGYGYTATSYFVFVFRPFLPPAKGWALCGFWVAGCG